MPSKIVNVYDNKNSAVRDAFTMLAANIHLSNNQKILKTFAVTSCNPKEGKTSLAINLAIAMANASWKVLLIDADMRKPAAAKSLYEEIPFGLSDYLAEKVSLQEVICETNIDNFNYISCGNRNRNPIGLLCSVRFEDLVKKMRKEYDCVLFDTPALASVADATLVASIVDTTILVAEMGYTKLPDLRRVKEQLGNLNADILGVVLNKVKKRDYKLYYGFYDYFFNSNQFFKKKNAKVNKRDSVSVCEETSQVNMIIE